MTLHMHVVSNTSPLWNLASIDKLGLLQDQFSEIYIPHEVWQELSMGHEHPEVARIQQAINARWISVKPLSNPYLLQSLTLKLELGESAAIVLALETDTTKILMDEADGRTTAKAMGLKPIGILGVLLHAKNTGKIISSIKKHGAA